MKQLDTLPREALSTVAQLAASARVTEAHIALLEEKLQAAEAEFRRITEEALPAAMMELGLTQLKLEDGASITIKDEVHVGIPKSVEPQALEFLRTHELGDVIKNQVILSFGKGEDEKAEAAMRALTGMACPYARKEFVHPQTLKALAREKIEAGDPLPEDLFGVHIINRAVIKRS